MKEPPRFNVCEVTEKAVVLKGNLHHLHEAQAWVEHLREYVVSDYGPRPEFVVCYEAYPDEYFILH